MIFFNSSELEVLRLEVVGKLLLGDLAIAVLVYESEYLLNGVFSEFQVGSWGADDFEKLSEFFDAQVTML